MQLVIAADDPVYRQIEGGVSGVNERIGGQRDRPLSIVLFVAFQVVVPPGATNGTMAPLPWPEPPTVMDELMTGFPVKLSRELQRRANGDIDRGSIAEGRPGGND